MIRPFAATDRGALMRALEPYAGQWVAIRYGRVVAADPDPATLVVYLRDKGIKNTLLRRVPHPGEPEIMGLG